MNTNQKGIKRLFWTGVGTAAMVLAGCATMWALLWNYHFGRGDFGLQWPAINRTGLDP
jgi:hypothetical protein